MVDNGIRTDPYCRRLVLTFEQSFQPRRRVLLVDAIYPAISDAQAIFGGHVAEPASWITAEQARGRFVILAQPDGSRGASTDVAHDPRFREAVAVGYTNFGQAFRLMARLYPSVDSPPAFMVTTIR